MRNLALSVNRWLETPKKALGWRRIEKLYKELRKKQRVFGEIRKILNKGENRGEVEESVDSLVEKVKDWAPELEERWDRYKDSLLAVYETYGEKDLKPPKSNALLEKKQIHPEKDEKHLQEECR